MENAASRNGLIGKIHVAKKQLALTEDSYRAILCRITGVESLKAMSISGLEKVLNEFKRLGFKPKGGKRAGQRRHAESSQASKIRALWLDLFHIGEVSDPSEEAIDQFVKRTCAARTMQWMNTAQGDVVIRALRGWLVRRGFTPPRDAFVKELSFYRHRAGLNDNSHDLRGIAWKVSLIVHQMALLGIDENQETAPQVIAAEYLDEVIEGYGRAIRGMKVARGQA